MSELANRFFSQLLLILPLLYLQSFPHFSEENVAERGQQAKEQAKQKLQDARQFFHHKCSSIFHIFFNLSHLILAGESVTEKAEDLRERAAEAGQKTSEWENEEVKLGHDIF